MKNYYKTYNQSGNKMFVFHHWKALAAFLMAFMMFSIQNVAEAQDTPGEYQSIVERGAAVGIDAERLETLVARAQSREIPPTQLEEMVGPAFSLAENDLPHLSVLQKAMEGMAKRVPAVAIQNVLEQMEHGINRSVDIVDPWMARAEVRNMLDAGRGARERDVAAREVRNMFLETASYAFQQNVGEETVRDFLDQIVSERVAERGHISSVAAGLRALPDMPMTQDNPGMSIRLLIRALNDGFTAGEIQQLPDAFRSAQFHSQLPAENIATALDRLMGRNIPAAHILENLFQGNIGGGPPGFALPAGPGRGKDDNTDRGRDRGRRPPVIPPVN